MENLFGNPGGKIKVVAFITFLIEAIAAVISGFYMMAEEDALAGLLIIVVGIGVAYLSTLMIYALGELVEKMTKTEENTRR